MTAYPSAPPALFADAAVPDGTITDTAAEALAALVWVAAEEEMYDEDRAATEATSSSPNPKPANPRKAKGRRKPPRDPSETQDYGSSYRIPHNSSSVCNRGAPTGQPNQEASTPILDVAEVCGLRAPTARCR